MKTYKDHRKAITDRLQELGKSKYWLSQQLDGVISDQMLYAYLRGDRATTSEKFEAICGVLGLELTWEQGNRKKAKR